MTGQLHAQKLFQPLKSPLREPENEARELPWGADPKEAFADESKSVYLGAFTVHMGRSAIEPGRELVRIDRRRGVRQMLRAEKEG